MSTRELTLSRRAGAARHPLRSLPPYYLTVPSLLAAGAMLLPLVYLVVRATSSGTGAWEMLWRFRTPQIMLNTAALAAAVTASSVLLGVPLAWLTTRSDMPLRRFWSVLAVLPLAVPSLVGGFAFIGAFGYGGALHQWLQGLGVRLPDIYGFRGAWAVLTMLSYPYVVLAVRAALLGMDAAQEEAARTLGQGRWETFLRVTMPQLRPAIAAGGLLVTLYVLSDFAAVSLLQYDTFTRAIYIQYEASFNRHRAALLSLILVALALIIVAAEARTRGRARYHRSGGGANRDLKPIPLGRWRGVAVAFCGAVTVPSVGIPFATSLYWLVQGVQRGEPLLLPWNAVWNSVSISALAAAATVLAALPMGILIVRYPGPLARMLERVAYAGYSLPGIVIALSLVFFGANYARPLYQTHAMLIAAYAILFFPQALGAIRTSLLQINPNLEDAARSLGAPPLRTLWQVTVPLLRSGLAAAAGLVFLTAVKELPATLLLSPTGFQTLTTHVWGAIGEAYYARAAAPALLLILASSVSVAMVLRHERNARR